MPRQQSSALFTPAQAPVAFAQHAIALSDARAWAASTTVTVSATSAASAKRNAVGRRGTRLFYLSLKTAAPLCNVYG